MPWWSQNNAASQEGTRNRSLAQLLLASSQGLIFSTSSLPKMIMKANKYNFQYEKETYKFVTSFRQLRTQLPLKMCILTPALFMKINTIDFDKV
mmetsp:Transcript_30038/g.39521  ORF Transcript_30038/g.39521 Transcript_30038/m.39521 type:complete len:94 (-) Transcript_30038:210-491(-)